MKHTEYLKRMAEGEWLTLPSGLEVRVRPVDSAVLLQGKYPSELMAIVRQHIAGRTQTEQEILDALSESDQTLQLFESSRQWGEVLAKEVVLEPKLVDGDPENESQMSVQLISTSDLGFLSSLINLPLARLHPFCLKQNARMELVFAGKDDADDALGGNGAEGDGAAVDGGDRFATVPVDGKADHR